MNNRIIASSAARLLKKQHGVPAFMNASVRSFHQTQFRRDEEEETPKQTIKVKPAWQGYVKDIKNLFYYPITFLSTLLLGGFIYRYLVEEGLKVQQEKSNKH